MFTPTFSGLPVTPIDGEHYKVWHKQLTNLVGRLERVASSSDNRSKLVESIGDALATGWFKGYPIPPHAYLKLVAVESPIANDRGGKPLAPAVTVYHYDLGSDGRWSIILTGVAGAGTQQWGIYHANLLKAGGFLTFEEAKYGLIDKFPQHEAAIQIQSPGEAKPLVTTYTYDLGGGEWTIVLDSVDGGQRWDILYAGSHHTRGYGNFSLAEAELIRFFPGKATAIRQATLAQDAAAGELAMRGKAMAVYDYKLADGLWTISSFGGGPSWSMAHDGIKMRGVFGSFEAAEAQLIKRYPEQAMAIRKMTEASAVASIIGKDPVDRKDVFFFEFHDQKNQPWSIRYEEGAGWGVYSYQNFGESSPAYNHLSTYKEAMEKLIGLFPQHEETIRKARPVPKEEEEEKAVTLINYMLNDGSRWSIYLAATYEHHGEIYQSWTVSRGTATARGAVWEGLPNLDAACAKLIERFPDEAEYIRSHTKRQLGEAVDAPVEITLESVSAAEEEPEAPVVPSITLYKYDLKLDGHWAIWFAAGQVDATNPGGQWWSLGWDTDFGDSRHENLFSMEDLPCFEAAEAVLLSAFPHHRRAILTQTIQQQAMVASNPCAEITLDAPKENSLPMPENQPVIPEDDGRSQYFELPGGEWTLHYCGEHRWCIFKTDSNGDEEWTGKSWITEDEALHWLGEQFPSYKDYINQRSVAVDTTASVVIIDLDTGDEEGPLIKIHRLVDGRYRMTSIMMDEPPEVIHEDKSFDACVIQLIKAYPDREAEIDLKWRGAKLEVERLRYLGEGGKVAQATSEAHTVNTEAEQWCQERLRTQDKFDTGWILPIPRRDGVFAWWAIYQTYNGFNSKQFQAVSDMVAVGLKTGGTMEEVLHKLANIYPDQKAAIWTRYEAYKKSREDEEAPPADAWVKAKVDADGKPGTNSVILPIENKKGDTDWWVLYESKTADSFGRDQFVAYSEKRPLGLSSSDMLGLVAGLREMYPEQRANIKKMFNDLYSGV